MMRLRHIKPNAPFRTVTQYSNTIYSLLGHIAEVAAAGAQVFVSGSGIFSTKNYGETISSMHRALKEQR